VNLATSPSKGYSELRAAVPKARITASETTVAGAACKRSLAGILYLPI
jgi:hypothetical protein